MVRVRSRRPRIAARSALGTGVVVRLAAVMLVVLASVSGLQKTAFAATSDPLMPQQEFIFEETVLLNQSAFVARLKVVTSEGKPAIRIRFYRAR